MLSRRFSFSFFNFPFFTTKQYFSRDPLTFQVDIFKLGADIDNGNIKV